MNFFDKILSRSKQREIRKKYAHNVMYFLAKLAFKTCKNRFHVSEYAKNHQFIACLWHGSFLMMPFFYMYVRKQPNMSFITSAHEDAIMVEQYFAKFGLQSIRGSTGIHKGGARALMQAVREVKAGKDVAVTPDGPRGPYKSIANGILLMAMKSGIPICGCRVQPKSYWELKTWDKFCIPKPFTRIDYFIIDPLFLPPEIDIEEAREKLRQYMQDLDSLPIEP